MLSGAGLVINPTFDSSILTDPNSATIQATINMVIAEYQAAFSDPITVNVTFKTMSGGLSSSSWNYYYIPYSTFRADLAAGASTSNDTTALAHIPNTATDPILGGTYVIVNTANMKALDSSYNDMNQDGTVFLNTSIMNLDRVSINAAKYDMASCVAHELDEVLGLGSYLNPYIPANYIRPEDLFRYDGSGNRSFTNSSSALAYFSIDGTTKIVQFNQSSSGDYGDWASSATKRVQDAFGTKAVIIDPSSAEYTALDVIGYHYVGSVSVSHAPVGTSKTVTTLENSAYTFATADFGFSDPNDSPANTLSAVKITTLPAAGSLKDNGVAVTAGQFISIADITGGKLVFTPATYASGTNYASFTFQVQDNGSTSGGGANLDTAARTMTINVTAVSQAPVGASKTITILENGSYTFASADFGFTDPNDSPANTLSGVKITTLPLVGTLKDNGVLVTLGQIVPVADITGGKLVYTPVTYGNGTAYSSFTFQVQDNGSTSNGGAILDLTARTMTFNVTAVSQAPTGTSNTVSTLENAPYLFVTADFGFGDPNDSPANSLAAVKVTTLPSAGILTDNGTTVTVGQSIPVADITGGKLIFTPVTYASGNGYANFTFQVQDNGSTSNGGVTLDPTPKTMTINVVAVSQSPSGTSNTITTLENAAYTFAAADFGFSDPNDSPANTLSGVKITTLPTAGTLKDNGVLVTTGQIVTVADITGGKLVFIPASYANGNAYSSFTFQVQDTGSTSNGGSILDPTARTMTINVTAVASAPTGTSSTVTTLENTAYTFAVADFGFSDPNDTPANTLSGVKITTLPAAGTLTDNGVAVVAGQIIAVADITGGKLIFTPATYANGTPYTTFTFQVQDTGSTTNGGINLDSSAKTMSMNVTSVAQAPVGTSTTVTTLESTTYTFAVADFGLTDPNDSPANALAAVKIATLPAAGSLKDNGVAVTVGQFIPVADITGGKLVFTPATYANGANYASFTFQVQDNGSTSNGGVNLDPVAKTMTINVTAVASAPTGTANTVTTLENTGYTFAVADFGFSDPNDSPANTLSAVKITTLPVAGSLKDNGVAVTVGQVIPVADITGGKLVFTPVTYANGTNYASFTFQVQDNGSTTNGGVTLDPGAKTMTINVTAVASAPTGTSTTVTTLESTAYTFAMADFGFSDPNDSPANTLSAVKITTLPAAGSLKDNGVAVTVGQVIPVADITGNKLVFTPVTYANGAAYSSFTFQVQDNGSTASGGVNLDPSAKTMTINVTPVASSPTGTSNTVTTLENTAYVFAVADFGFSDPNDSPANSLSGVKIATLPVAGTLTDNGVAVTLGQIVAVADITGGKLIFTPATYANGTSYSSFTFQVQDNGSTINGGVTLDPGAKTMTINVTAVASAPSGTSNTVTTLESTPYTFAIADFGFSDPNDTPANTLSAVKITTLPATGSLKDNGVAVTLGQIIPVADITGGKLIFTPAAYANGAGYASFTFQVQDNGSTASGGVNLDPTAKTMTINVTPVASAPTGTSNTVVTVKNAAYTFAATDFGFSDPNDSPANTLAGVKITTLPAAGTLTDLGVAVTAGQVIAVAEITGGKLVFTPATNAKGTGYASFTFQVQDSGLTASGGVNLDPTAKTMTIDVNDIASAPLGTSNTVMTLENTAYIFAVADFGFSDPNDSPANTLAAVKITTLPGAGTLTDNGVAVTAGQIIAVADITGGKLIFAPAAYANGTSYAGFTFQVQDNGSIASGGANLDPSAKTMTVNVTAVASAPTGTSNTITTLENAAYTFAVADFGFSDPNDSPVNTLAAVKITTLPVTGSLKDNGVAVTVGQFIPVADITAGKLVFTPGAYANGTNYASFTFQVQDNGSTSNGGVNLDPSAKAMTINVTPVASAPTGTSTTVTTLESTAYTFAVADFGFSDPNDSAANTLSAVKIATLPAAGSLTDNGVAVTLGQFIPVADITGGKLVFTPAAYANGAGYASFTFQDQDNGSTTNGGVNLDPVAQTMAINVTAVASAPTGTSNTITTLESTAYTFAAADFGFSDPNDTPANTLAAVKITTLPAAGSLKDNGVAVTVGQVISVADITGGKLIFTPAAYANGTSYASFTFQVQDNGSTSNGGVNLDPSAKTMTINVTPVASAPTGTSTTVTTLESTAYTFAVADFGFSDPNDTPANTLSAVKITTLPAAGSLKDNGAAVTVGQFIAVADIAGGKLVFTPVTYANSVGYASFKFQVQDNGSTASGGVNVDPVAKTMTINVTAVASAPKGTSNTLTMLENGSYTFAVADFGFSDPNDSPANTLSAVKITTLPTAGSLKDNGVAVTVGQLVPVADITSGKLIFTPATYASGSGYSTFTFQVQDNGSTTNGGVVLDPTAKTMTFNVTTVNQSPAGTSNTVTTLENAPYTFGTADFGFSDPNDTPANNLLAVKITALPTAGTLKDNDVAVTVGQFVPVADITGGKLVFTPANYASGNSYSNFTFQVQDSGSTANGGANLDPIARTMTVNVTPVSQAPSGTTNRVSTMQDSSYTFVAADFGFLDPNDTPANNLTAVAVTTIPSAGTLTNNGLAVTAGQFISLSDITSGNLIFTPAPGMFGTGYASFKFQVQDDGSTSNGGVNLDPTAKTMTIDVTSNSAPVNQAPTGTTNTVTTLENVGYTFGVADFGFNDPNDSPANNFTAVKITTLPSAGALTDNGVAVSAGQVVSVADISSGKLVFTPDNYANGSAYSSFTFQVEDDGATANGGVNLDPVARTMTINVTSVDQAPVGTSSSVTMLENSPYIFVAADFGFTDPYNTPANSLVAVKITTLPSAGTLSDNGTAVTVGQFITVADINAGLLQFTPAMNASGTAYANFTFQVQSNGSTTNGGANLDPNPDAMTLNVTFVNQPPVLSGIETTTLAALGLQPNFVTATLAAADPDNANLTGATIQISGNYVSNQDQLVFTNTATITGSWDASTGTLTLSGSDTVANYQTALQSVAYQNMQTSPDTSVTRTVSFQVTDGSLWSNAQSRSLTVTPNTAPPTVTGVNGTSTFVQKGSAITVAPGIIVDDPAGLNINSATVTFTNWQPGDRADFSNIYALQHSFTTPTATTAVLTISGNDTPAHYQALLQSVVFWSVAGVLNTSPRTATFTVTDTNSISGSGSQTVAATTPPPAVTGVNSTSTFVQLGLPVTVAPSLAVNSPSSLNVSSATVTFTNWQAGDRADFSNLFALQHSFVTSGNTAVLTISGNDTVAHYQTMLRTVLFWNVAGVLNTSPRAATFTVTDSNSNSGSGSQTIAATTPAPAVAGVNGTSTFVQLGLPVAVAPGITITSPASVNITSATVTFTNWLPGDRMEFSNVYALQRSYVTTGTTAVLTISGTDTAAHYQTLLRSVVFWNVAGVLNVSPRAATFTVTDANGNSGSGRQTIAATTPAPTVSGVNSTVTYIQQGAQVNVLPSIVVADPMGLNFTSATVTFTNWQGGDRVDFSNIYALAHTLTYPTPTTAVLTISGTATPAQYQKLLQSVIFWSVAGVANTTTRVANVTVTDTNGNSGAGTQSVAVTVGSLPPAVQVNDATALTYNANSSPVAIFSNTLVGDPDSNNLTKMVIKISAGYQNNVFGSDILKFTNQLGITGAFDAATGTLTLTGSSYVGNYRVALRSVQFSATGLAVSTANRTFTVVATDDGTPSPTSSVSVSRTITVTNTIVSASSAVAPTSLPPVVIVNDSSSLTYKANSGPIAIFGNALVSDPDSNNLTKMVIQISGGYQNDAFGSDVLTFTNQLGITGSFDASTGTLTLTGSSYVGNYRIALRSVLFKATGSAVSTANRVFTVIATDDGSASSTSVSRTMTVTP